MACAGPPKAAETPPAPPAATPEPAAEVLDLSAMTKEELYATAQDLEIKGRSDMNKDELIGAHSPELGGFDLHCPLPEDDRAFRPLKITLSVVSRIYI